MSPQLKENAGFQSFLLTDVVVSNSNTNICATLNLFWKAANVCAKLNLFPKVAGICAKSWIFCLLLSEAKNKLSQIF